MYVWTTNDHSGWKAMSNYPLGYVIAGNKFFEPDNTSVFVTGFNDLSKHEWTTTNSVVQHGFSGLDVLWKSYTNIGPAASPSGFFIATSGQKDGTHSYYTLQIDKTGGVIREAFGDLPNGWTFGAAAPGNDGGFITVGSSSMGTLVVTKFLADGTLDWNKDLAIQGFGWTIKSAPGGGYVIGSTKATATRIDNDGNIVWSTAAVLPVSPPPDGSAYTYTEFEEILPQVHTGSGFVMTGSAFSNSTSAAYTAYFNWEGSTGWSKINDAVNTGLPGTPVAWTNSAVEKYSPDSGTWNVLYTWRHGPVSSGGDLKYDLMNGATGTTVQSGGLNNTIPVQEAFTIPQLLLNRVVIGGTRGGYGGVYSYSITDLPEGDLP